VTCIRQARSNENFRQLSKLQQNVILQRVWSELFVLRASHWPINITSIIDRSVRIFFSKSINTFQIIQWPFQKYLIQLLFVCCNRFDDDHLKSVILNTQCLKADLIELSLLETLILCRKGNYNTFWFTKSEVGKSWVLSIWYSRSTQMSTCHSRRE
jgi:nuclear receptor, other families, insect